MVITVASSFSHDGQPDCPERLGPGVFVDVDIPSYNIDVQMLEAGALSDRTPGDHDRTHAWQPVRPSTLSRRSAREHDLWLIEDCCDALGSTYRGKNGRDVLAISQR